MLRTLLLKYSCSVESESPVARADSKHQRSVLDGTKFQSPERMESVVVREARLAYEISLIQPEINYLVN